MMDVEQNTGNQWWPTGFVQLHNLVSEWVRQVLESTSVPELPVSPPKTNSLNYSEKNNIWLLLRLPKRPHQRCHVNNFNRFEHWRKINVQDSRSGRGITEGKLFQELEVS